MSNGFWARLRRRLGMRLLGLVGDGDASLGDRAATRRASSESEQQFRILVQGLRDCAIFMLDTGGHVTTWNAGAAHIKGYETPEIVGRHYSVFYTDQDRRAGVPENALLTASREGKYEAEG